MPKKTYYVNIVTNHSEEVESTVETTHNKREAIKREISEAKKQRQSIRSWSERIRELSIEVEDETGETIDIRIAFDRDSAYNDYYACKPYKWH